MEPTPNVTINYKSLSDQHEKVLDNVLSGMLRWKCWTSVYKTCSSKESARNSVRELLKRESSQLYMSEKITERESFVSEDNQLTNNGICAELAWSIKQSKTIAKQCYSMDDITNASKMMSIHAQSVEKYAKFTGLGIYNPSVIPKDKSNKSVASQSQLSRIEEGNSNSNGVKNSSNGVNNSITGTQPTSYDFIKDITAQIVDE